MATASSRLESIIGAVAPQRHGRWTSRPRPSCRAWLTHPRTGRRATLFVPWNAQIGSHQLPSSVASLHRLRSAGRLRWSQWHVARNTCPLTTHACFVLGFCLLLQSVQPRLASANLECVILALSSPPGTCRPEFSSPAAGAEALHGLSLNDLLWLHATDTMSVASNYNILELRSVDGKHSSSCAFIRQTAPVLSPVSSRPPLVHILTRPLGSCARPSRLQTPPPSPPSPPPPPPP